MDSFWLFVGKREGLAYAKSTGNRAHPRYPCAAPQPCIWVAHLRNWTARSELTLYPTAIVAERL